MLGPIPFTGLCHLLLCDVRPVSTLSEFSDRHLNNVDNCPLSGYCVRNVERAKWDNDNGTQ